MAALINHSDISSSDDFHIRDFNSKYQDISTAINSGVGTSLSYGGGTKPSQQRRRFNIHS